MSWILIFAVVIAGAATPWMSGAEGELNARLTTPVWGAVFVYASGLLGLLAVQAFLREPLPVDKVASVPLWAWTSGVLSLGATIVALTIAQKMGSAYFTGVSVTASLVMSLALDHFGLIGFKQHTASPARLAGAALMIAGLWVVAKF